MHYRKEEKAMWVEDWRKSGKSVWGYAKENGLVPQTFARWTKDGPDRKQVFVEVPAPVTCPAPQIPGILIEKGDVKIHVPLMTGRNELRAIMEGLGAAP